MDVVHLSCVCVFQGVTPGRSLEHIRGLNTFVDLFIFDQSEVLFDWRA